MPPQVGYLFDWFNDIARGRPQAMVGVARLPYSEVLAWAALTRRQLASWEVDALIRLDDAYVSVVSEMKNG